MAEDRQSSDNASKRSEETADQVQLSTTIKSFHYHLQQKMTTSAGIPVHDESAEARWFRLLAGEEARLTSYATAMHHIATRYWDASPSDLIASTNETDQPMLGSSCVVMTEHQTCTDAVHVSEVGTKRPRDGALKWRTRHNNRLQYALQCIADYYLGEASVCDGEVPHSMHETDSRSPSPMRRLPRLALRRLKAWRVNFFTTNGRTANACELTSAAMDILRDAPPITAAARVRGFLAWNTSPNATALRVVDVGSCYNPFFGAHVTNGVLRVPLAVSALDLSPYTGRGVWRADWIAARFVPLNDTTPLLQVTASGLEVQRGGFDVVLFCLMLSFLPHPRLRYRACLHAALALRPGGLLVVVSTRTQGTRRRAWVEDWIGCIEGIGFRRVHKDVMGLLVGMSFSWEGGLPEEDAAVWMEQMMATPEAESGLRITGDDVM